MTIRVVVVEDQQLVAAGLVVLLDSQPDIDVVGTADNGQQAIELCRRLTPDVALMDIRMPIMDGLSATKRIVAETATRVVVLTTYNLDEYVYDALRAGASGFLLKHAAPEELLLGVRAASEGDALLAPAITRNLIEAFVAKPFAPKRPPAALQRLTAREREVFDLVARGQSNFEIAHALFVAETTVKTHLGHALDKLGLRDRIHAVVYAYETGLISADQP